MPILPFINPTADNPIVVLREPQENTDIDTLLNNTIKHHGWAAGVIFTVCFTNREMDEVFGFCQFMVRVNRELPALPSDNPYVPPSPQARREVAWHQLGDWVSFVKSEPKKKKSA